MEISIYLSKKSSNNKDNCFNLPTCISIFWRWKHICVWHLLTLPWNGGQYQSTDPSNNNVDYITSEIYSPPPQKNTLAFLWFGQNESFSVFI